MYTYTYVILLCLWFVRTQCRKCSCNVDAYVYTDIYIYIYTHAFCVLSSKGSSKGAFVDVKCAPRWPSGHVVQLHVMRLRMFKAVCIACLTKFASLGTRIQVAIS